MLVRKAPHGQHSAVDVACVTCDDGHITVRLCFGGERALDLSEMGKQRSNHLDGRDKVTRATQAEVGQVDLGHLFLSSSRVQLDAGVDTGAHCGHWSADAGRRTRSADKGP